MSVGAKPVFLKICGYSCTYYTHANQETGITYWTVGYKTLPSDSICWSKKSRSVSVDIRLAGISHSQLLLNKLFLAPWLSKNLINFCPLWKQAICKGVFFPIPGSLISFQTSSDLFWKTNSSIWCINLVSGQLGPSWSYLSKSRQCSKFFFPSWIMMSNWDF